MKNFVRIRAIEYEGPDPNEMFSRGEGPAANHVTGSDRSMKNATLKDCLAKLEGIRDSLLRMRQHRDHGNPIEETTEYRIAMLKLDGIAGTLEAEDVAQSDDFVPCPENDNEAHRT